MTDPHRMTRRRFGGLLGAGALAIQGGQLWAAAPSGEQRPAGSRPRFLLVFLRGGYDATSLLVPTSSSFYYEVRPHIAIARPSGDPASALPLSSDWALHPALRESVLPLWQAGQAAFIPFAGTPDTSRSHFETQDGIELGQQEGPGRDFRSGFMNRLATELGGRADAMAFTDQLPLCFQGRAQVANTALRSVGKPALDARQSAIISDMYRTSGLSSAVNEGFAVRDQVARDLAAEMDASSRNAVSTKGFEAEARRVARLMRDRYALGFVDVGGWDTHVNQGAGTGYLASRLDELGRGLAGYAQEMGPDWRDTTVVVVSEFGRTFRENGNRGTDHGHGSVYWVLGGGLRGGRIAGEQVKVEASTLFQNRDWPVLTDYRALLAGLFSRQWGLRGDALGRVFPGAGMTDLSLV